MHGLENRWALCRIISEARVLHAETKGLPNHKKQMKQCLKTSVDHITTQQNYIFRVSSRNFNFGVKGGVPIKHKYW